MRLKVNIKMLSEMSGFSPATVSNALNGKKGVNHETAQKILALAKEYGYIPENHIESIRVVTYRDSGEVLSDAPFFNELLESVTNVSRELQLETKLVNLYRQSDSYDAEVAAILADTDSAILLVGTELSEEDAKPFLHAKVPLILLDASFDRMQFDSVLMDNRNSMQDAVDYLVAKGHKIIGYLGSEVETPNFQSRHRGYQQAMKRHELAIEKKFLFKVPVSIVGAYRRFGEILEGGAEMPTAFVADNDMIALGCMQALQKHDYRIPEDISVIGFDDINFSSVFAPGLTTMRIHTKELGEIAVRKLLDRVQHPDRIHTKTKMYTELIERGSVAAPRES